MTSKERDARLQNEQNFKTMYELWAEWTQYRHGCNDNGYNKKKKINPCTKLKYVRVINDLNLIAYIINIYCYYVLLLF